MSSVNGQSQLPRAMDCGQELIPGIPDHITVQHIASKVRWKTCNVLQKVSRGWLDAIRHRSVYNARVLSKSTEAFLVTLCGSSGYEINLTLFSCKDGSSLQLPPLNAFSVYPVDCICLDGRIYVWVVSDRVYYPFRELWVLDLAGERKWTQREQVEFRKVDYGWGALGGKIYRFGGSAEDHRVLEGRASGNDLHGPTPASSIQRRALTLPLTDVYDPEHDVWSLITPEPLPDHLPIAWPFPSLSPLYRFIPSLSPLTLPFLYTPEEDFRNHVASFSVWEREQWAACPAEASLTNGRYQAYFSEWRRKQLVDCPMTSAIDNDCHNTMAAQVYYKHPVLQLDGTQFNEDIREVLFFFGEKLIKFDRRESNEALVNMRFYDTEKNMWEQWKSFSATILHPNRNSCLTEICDCVSADHIIWAFVRVTCSGSVLNYSLVRSPDLHAEDNDDSVLWTDTGYAMDPKCERGIALRPIYL